MKRLFRKNQIIITALAIMIVIAGYLNFTADQTKPVKKEAESQTARSFRQRIYRRRKLQQMLRRILHHFLTRI